MSTKPKPTPAKKPAAEKAKKFVPRGQYVSVLIDGPDSNKNAYGLYVPENETKDKKATGIIKALGSKASDDLKVGDHVVFGAFAGEILKIAEGKKEVEYASLHDDDIMGFIK